uniref:Uncharacterized protein n=1 Tax=Arion vulgaris TaxID=1028688 RepID=A0A0B7AAQ8_9EUPU
MAKWLTRLPVVLKIVGLNADRVTLCKTKQQLTKTCRYKYIVSRIKRRRIYFTAPGLTPYGSVPLRRNCKAPAESITQGTNSPATILGVWKNMHS